MIQQVSFAFDFVLGAAIGIVVVFGIVKLAHLFAAALLVTVRQTGRVAIGTVDFLAKLYQAAFGLLLCGLFAAAAYFYYTTNEQRIVVQTTIEQTLPVTSSLLNSFSPAQLTLLFSNASDVANTALRWIEKIKQQQ